MFKNSIFKPTLKARKINKSRPKKKKGNIIISIFTEMLMFIRNIGLGVFTLIDKLIFIILAVFSSIALGFSKLFLFLWKKGFYQIFHEVWLVFKNVYFGAKKICVLVFYELPAFIIKSFASLFYTIYRKSKVNAELSKQNRADFSKKVKDYFTKKYDGLTIVKYYRNKREKNLVVLELDKSKEAKRSEEKHTYMYLARNKEGKLIKGYFSALSKLDTHSYLLDEGYTVYEIQTSKWIDFVHGESKYKKAVSTKDLVFWLTQVSTYIKSGVPLTESIKILAKQDKKRSHKKIYDSIIYELTMGETFSEALRRQGNVYPPLLINMIKAAEMIGDIESTLDEMAEYYKEMEETRKSIISAISYPICILIFAIGVVIFLLIYIIPQFVSVFNSTGAKINSLTQFMVDSSEFLKTNYLLILFMIGLVIIVYTLLYKNVKAFKTTMQYFTLKLPIIGNIIIYKEITLFTKTFAALNKNNIVLTDSIDILSKITNNEIYKSLMFETISNLIKGEKMSKSFENNWIIPDLAYYMITTGEATGELSEMLDRTSEYYQNEQKLLVNTLKTFIEPALIIFLAVVVGAVVLSVVMPMMDMYGTIT